METRHIEAGTDEDQAFVMTVLANPDVDWHVASVESLPDYCLHVRFRDGLEGNVFMRERVFAPRAGVFSTLADPETFTQVSVDEGGAVVWANGLDLAPDSMYYEIKQHGEWVLR